MCPLQSQGSSQFTHRETKHLPQPFKDCLYFCQYFNSEFSEYLSTFALLHAKKLDDTLQENE